MEQLLNAATELVSLLSPDRIQAIAERMKTEQPGDGHGLKPLVGTQAARSALDSLVEAWKGSGVSGEVIAGILLGASYARRKTQAESAIELVWTGPTTPHYPTRRTEQVLLDLIRNARNEIFLVSFVAYDLPTVASELNHAADRGVEMNILLESSASQGGSLTVDPVATIRSRIPSAQLYVWIDRPHPFTDGRVHAKVAVADRDVAFLTSANLTGHALEKNMEAGVVIHGGHIPAGLHAHLHALAETKVISRL